jgi:hypothetical protein
MKIRIFTGVLSVFIMCACGCTAVSSDFSADAVSKSGRESFTGKAFVSGAKVRMEMQGAASITRPDKNVVWVLLPAQQMYMEQALDIRTLVATTDKPQGQIERTRVGQEMVDGKMCQKFKVVYDHQGRKDVVFQWVFPGMSMPIKTASPDGSWSMEFRNVRPGPQQGALFEVPAGYKKFSQGMPSAKDVLGGALKDIF